MTVFRVDFEPVGRRGECRRDESLQDCARRLGVGISSLCGGQGTCHSCRVRVVSGKISPPTPSEREAFSSAELKQGWRLACQCYPRGDVKLHIPAESMTTLQRLQVEGQETEVRIEPGVKAYRLKLAAPSLAEPQADADRLLEALNKKYKLDCRRVDIGALRLLPDQLRSWDWQCQAVVRGDEVIALLPAARRPLGLAVDLGTTKIAGYLVDLTDGRTLAAEGVMNPQISYGEDIISRINAAAQSSQDGTELQRLAAEAIGKLAAELCTKADAGAQEIVEAVVVGNTAMHHLFLGLPVKQLAVSPFVPAVSDAMEVKARRLGLEIAPGASVYLLPNIAGFVGADHVAALLATGISGKKGTVLTLDIGTNTEVSLVHDSRITATSCASGPAFEGGHIKHGMRATTGAIEHLQISGDGVRYQTIDEAPPAGICGSGIVDALAQLYLNGIIDEGGRMVKSHPNLRTVKGRREFVLAWGEEGRPAVTITQQDVRELQLAKAAIRSGIQALLEANGIAEEAIEEVVIAGAFGSYIDVGSAVESGMLPSLPLERFRQAGNAAGMGAKQSLLSLESRAQARAIASGVEYVELSSAPGFNDTFMQAGYLGRYRITNGRREGIG